MTPRALDTRNGDCARLRSIGFGEFAGVDQADARLEIDRHSSNRKQGHQSQLAAC